MPFSMYNQNLSSSAPLGTDAVILATALNGNAWVDGGVLSEQSTPDYSLKITAGDVQCVGVGVVSFAANTSISFAPAPSGADHRIDLVAIDNTGALWVIEGEIQPSWLPPDVPNAGTDSAYVVLWYVLIPPGTTVLTNDLLVDKRTGLGATRGLVVSSGGSVDRVAKYSGVSGITVSSASEDGTNFKTGNRALHVGNSGPSFGGQFQMSSAGKVIFYANASPADGQLLIGKTGTPSTFEAATLTAGGGVDITNGSGAITLARSALTGDVTASAGSNATTIAAGAVTEAKQTLADNTTGNVTSSAHGYTPKSPADATQFLNGAATPAFAAVKGSDLSLADVTTNNVSSTAHGFAPKSPADATKFLNGAATPAYAQVKDSDLSTSDVTTNDVTTSKHGFTPKAPNDTSKFLRGDATWAAPTSAAYARSTGLTYNNDSTEHTLFSFTVTGNDLSTNKSLRIQLGGNMLINSGSVTVTFRVKLGSTTLWGDVSPTITNSATRKPWTMNFELGNLGATNSQGLYGRVAMGGSTAGSVAGLGDLAAVATAIVAEAAFSGSATEDSTTNLTLAVTAQISVANASNEIVMYNATASLL